MLKLVCLIIFVQTILAEICQPQRLPRTVFEGIAFNHSLSPKLIRNLVSSRIKTWESPTFTTGIINPLDTYFSLSGNSTSFILTFHLVCYEFCITTDNIERKNSTLTFRNLDSQVTYKININLSFNMKGRNKDSESFVLDLSKVLQPSNLEPFIYNPIEIVGEVLYFEGVGEKRGVRFSYSFMDYLWINDDVMISFSSRMSGEYVIRLNIVVFPKLFFKRDASQAHIVSVITLTNSEGKHVEPRILDGYIYNPQGKSSLSVSYTYGELMRNKIFDNPLIDIIIEIFQFNYCETS